MLLRIAGAWGYKADRLLVGFIVGISTAGGPPLPAPGTTIAPWPPALGVLRPLGNGVFAQNATTSDIPESILTRFARISTGDLILPLPWLQVAET